jgi:acyl-CoA thioester hydrolase
MHPPARKASALPVATAPPAFSLPVRVYYQDTDAGGVVFHARYLNFLERARTEWLRHIGYGVREVAERERLLFIVREVHAHYLRPALLDDQLTVTAGLEHMGRAHFTLVQRVLRGDEMLMRAAVNLACVSSDALKPARVPAHLRTALIRSMGWEVPQEEDE